MSRNQRLTFLGIAAVIAVVAIVILAGGTGDDSEQASSQQTATPSPTETPIAGATETATPTPTPKPQPPLLTGGTVKKLRFQEGDTVRFRVRNDAPEEVHVHGYDIAKDLEPGKVATVSFKATITGIFEIEFEHSAQQIAELRVDPK
jgi:FtsP/CotA-like multicopper oxidase with cupredoxin domain